MTLPVPDDGALTPSEVVLLSGERFAQFAARPKLRAVKAIMGALAIALGVWIGKPVFTQGSQEVIGGFAVVRFLASPIVAFMLLYVGLRAVWSLVRPGATVAGNVRLLDEATQVSAAELAVSMLKAAFLANERAGVLLLEVETDANRERLLATPLHAPVQWPRATLEGRLALDVQRAVPEIVYDWLGTASLDPWTRAIEQGMVMLTVRGSAVVERDRIGARRYRFSKTFQAAPTALLDETLFMLERCERERPQISKLLETSVREAVRHRTMSGIGRVVGEASPAETMAALDPWLDEREADRGLTAASAVRDVTGLASLIVSPLLIVLTAAVVNATGKWPLALVTAGLVLAVAAALWLPWLKAAAVKKRLSDVWHEAFRHGKPRPTTSGPTSVRRLASLTNTISIVTVPVVLLQDWTGSWTRTVAVLGVIVLYPVFRLLRARTVLAIGERVADERSERSSSQARIPREPAIKAEENSPVKPDVRLEILDGVTLPRPTSDSEARTSYYRERAPAIRSLYGRGILILAVGTTATALLAWVLARTGLGRAGVGTAFPSSTVGFLLITLLALPFQRSGKRMMTAASAEVAMKFARFRKRTELRDAVSIRPVLLPLLLGAWVMWSFIAAANIANDIDGIMGRGLGAAAYAGAFGFILLFGRWRNALERRYAPKPPLRLLALRVFGSSHLSDFLDLTSHWQWVGTRLRLDGPGTSGQRARDLLNYVAGRLDRSIVEDRTELQEELANFQERPDRELRFPVNAMQCHNEIWREAVDQLIDRSDAVVMDLAGLSSENRGVAWELGRIVARLEASRLIVLIDDTTNRGVLADVTAEAWAAAPPDSPNYRRPAALRVFDMGGSTQRLPNESQAEWQKRQLRLIDGHRLLGILVDAALPPRGTVSAPRFHEDLLQWSRFARRPLRVARNVAFAVFAGVLLTFSACGQVLKEAESDSAQPATPPR